MFQNCFVYFLQSSPDSIMKQITMKMEAFPENRVPNITTCMDRVKKGPNVCVDVIIIIVFLN